MRTGIEPRVRLVEEHDVRVEHERAGESGALAHPAGELVRHLVHGAAEADLSQTAHDDLADLVLALVGVLAQREGRVVEDVHRAEERAVLEQDTELLAHLEELVVGHARYRFAVDQHIAFVRVEQADHVLDADRLARAGGAEDHRDLVVGQAEVEAVQDRVAPERLLDVDELHGVGRAVVARAARVPLVGLLAIARLIEDVVRHLLAGRRPPAPAAGSSCSARPRVSSQSRGSSGSSPPSVPSPSRRSSLTVPPALLSRLSALSGSSPRRSACPPFRSDGPSRCSAPSTSRSRCPLPPARRSRCSRSSSPRAR